MLISWKTVLAVVGIASLMTIGLIVATSRSASAGPGEAPGLSAGVSALRNLPPATAMPRTVAGFVERAVQASNAVKHVQADPTEAKSKVRLLRSATGTLKSDVYAFQTREGLTCFIRIGDVGTCSRDIDDGTPGLIWTIGGGYGRVPSSLVGIASDDVKSVRVFVDGTEIPTSLRHNVVFGEFSGSAVAADIVIEHLDGQTNSVSVGLKG